MGISLRNQGDGSPRSLRTTALNSVTICYVKILLRCFSAGRTRLRNEQLHNLRSSPNIITAFKSRWVRWVGWLCSMNEVDEKRIQHFSRTSEEFVSLE